MRLKILILCLIFLTCVFLRGLLVVFGFTVWGWFHHFKFSASPWSPVGLRSLEFRRVMMRNMHGEVFFTAKTMRLTYDPRLLLRGKFQAALIQSEVEKPTFFFHRYKNGQWSTASVHFTPTIPRVFRPRLLLREADLAIADELWSRDNISLVSINHINGFLDFTDPLAVHVRLQGLYGERGDIKIRGKLLLPPLLGTLHVEAQHIPLVTFGNYLFPRLSMNLKNGEGSGDINLLLAFPHPPLFSGQMAVQRADVAFPKWDGLQITNSQIQLTLNTEFVEVDSFRGMLRKSPFSAHGIIFFPRSQFESFSLALQSQIQPFFIASAKIKRLDSLILLSKNRAWIPHASLVSAQDRLQFYGGWEGSPNPALVGKIQGKILDVPLSAAIAGAFHFESLNHLDGVFHWKDPNFSGSGIFNFNPQHSPVFFAVGKTPSLTVKGVTLKTGDWSFAWAGNHGNYAFVSPSLWMTGAFQPKNNFTSTFIGAMPIRSFDTVASGEWKTPHLNFSAVALGEWRKKKASLEGDFQIQPYNMTVHAPHLKAVMNHSLYDLSGDFSLNPNNPIRLQGSVEEGELADLLSLAPYFSEHRNSVTGKLTGNFKLAGTMKNPNGNFRFFLDRGQVLGEPISMAYTEGKIQHKKIYLNPLVTRFRENYVVAKGTLGINGAADIQVDAPQISLLDVNRLQQRFGALQGTASFHGKVKGSLHAPDISGTLDASNVQWKSMILDHLKLQGSFQDDHMAFNQLEILRKDGALTGNGSFAFGPEPALDIHLNVERARLEDLFSSPSLHPFGPIRGFISLSGDLSSLSGDFALSMENTGPLSGEASGKIRGSGLAFSSLKLRLGNGEISGLGDWRLDRPLRFFIQGENLDLAYAREIFKLPGNWGGLVNFHGEMDATLLHPRMALAVSVSKPYLQGFLADRLNGNLLYQDGKLLVSDGELTKGSGKLNISGQLMPLGLNFELLNQDLSIAQTYLPGLQGVGMANAKIYVHGKPGHYLFDGTGEIIGGKLAVQGLANPIEQLLLNLHILENQLEFEMTGILGKPFHGDAAFQLNGSDLSNFIGDGDIGISGRDLVLVIPNLASITTTTDFHMEKKANQWNLTGNALLESGIIDLNGLTSSSLNAMIPITSEMALDTTIQLTEKVHLLHPRFDASGLGGILHIGGTVEDPEFKGQITAVNGTLDLFGEPYKITEGRAMFSPEYRTPYLSLRAVSVRKINGSRLILNLQGRPGNMAVSLNANPPLAPDLLSMNLYQQQQVDQLFNVYPNPFGGTGGGTFYTSGGNTGSALNLSNVSLDILPGGTIALKLHKEIAPRISLIYARPLAYTQVQRTGITEETWGFEYEVTPRLTAQVTQDNLNGFGGLLVSRWNFY